MINHINKTIILFIVASLIVLALFTLWGYQWGYHNGLVNGQNIINKYQGELGSDKNFDFNNQNAEGLSQPNTGVPLPPLENKPTSTNTKQNNNSAPLPPIE